jgi:alpha-glucosidase (family GH31 glycosyl hydrolase)
VAPIYQETRVDEKGNDMRNGIYLPDGEWIDYFTGEKYQGVSSITLMCLFGSCLFFVKNGAIIPVTNPNNNVLEIKRINVFMRCILMGIPISWNMMMMEKPRLIGMVRG